MLKTKRVPPTVRGFVITSKGVPDILQIEVQLGRDAKYRMVYADARDALLDLVGQGGDQVWEVELVARRLVADVPVAEDEAATPASGVDQAPAVAVGGAS